MALLLVKTGLIRRVVKSIHPRLARPLRPREQAAARGSGRDTLL